MLLILGAPGSGKSVQAKMIEETANVKWLSVGKLLRERQDNDHTDEMDQGILIDSEYTEEVLAGAIEEVSNGTRILIDGFPRNEDQVDWFRAMAKAAHRDLQAIIHIKVPIEVVLERLLARGRTDDTEEVIKKRYKMYEEEIVPMIDHMVERGHVLLRLMEIAQSQRFTLTS